MEKENFYKTLSFLTDEFRYNLPNLKIGEILRLYNDPMPEVFVKYLIYSLETSLINWKTSMNKKEQDLMDRVNGLFSLRKYLWPKGAKYQEVMKDPLLFMAGVKALLEHGQLTKEDEILSDCLHTISLFQSLHKDISDFSNQSHNNPVNFNLINWVTKDKKVYPKLEKFMRVRHPDWGNHMISNHMIALMTIQVKFFKKSPFGVYDPTHNRLKLVDVLDFIMR